ncbi:hypothetical protein F938_00445 [Acinetobacter bereziniae LMG 1003 = CIP 70.12]|uniref:Uncharacterized protein n=2 Tax=Acinetobacter bereziniae TaxID=106648 RepID=N9F7V9_ACIBZ|nr:hypothetical protein [Acinetobacter bereziniae]ENW00929.1 hypothetical protein F938_00445 [Acinetobacter bereziniae LMG 1003 = CIP 70.12]MBJ8452969.1 hypothetical protein [Acinetobacter bereziniae]MBJ8457116.1 hypothetical protein [Acinetobacter bereziniae]
MNICFGGPLDGIKQSELFRKTNKKDYFIYEDKDSNSITTYFKVKVNSKGKVQVLWITEELMEKDLSKLIMNYIDKNI